MVNVSSYKTGNLSNKFTLIRLFLVCLLLQSTYPCGPGRGYGIRNRPKKMTPLVFKQHVPNVSENTLGASGLAEGAISRKDPKYKELVQNNNPEIVFKDEEGTGADRMMTQRCKDKLNALSIMVMNHWPGVKLRVTEGWDEDEHHSSDSLHYEGRAVDVTTSDRDRAKYGMLARLAVEAGFDWVYFESRGHIHCSVKSDSSIAVKTGGCFPGTSTVNLEDGQTMTMDRLSIGDRVQALDHKGALVFSEIIAFLHRTPDELMLFLELELDDGAKITLTEDHMIYATSSKSSGDVQLAGLLGNPYFAGHVRLGDTLYRNNGTSFQKSRVNRISQAVHTGVYAPLTREGTIVVDSMAASCYASFASHSIAQASMTPLRLAYSFADVIWSRDKTATPSSGVHWYARLLFDYAKYFLSDGSWYR